MNTYLLIILSLFNICAIAQSNTELIVKNKIDYISSLAREPMICEHPSGILFVTGYRNGSDSPQLWKSEDKGKSWKKVDVGTPEEGAVGNSDVDLFIDKKGNIYLLSMSFTKIPANTDNFDYSSLKGECITLGISRDKGQTWKWELISEKDYDDRPWITATTDGTLHIIWNDGKGVHHVTSSDDGISWKNKSDIYPKGGSSFLASGHNGQLAVRVAPLSASAQKIDEGVDFIRLSLDNGETWKDVKIPGTRTWTQDLSGIPRWVEPLVFDRENKLYMLWSEGNKLKLGTTKDYGKTWKQQTIFKSKDTLYFPYMEWSQEGILCTWLSGFEEIRHHAAILKNIDDKIEIYAIESKKVDIWSEFQGNYRRSTGGEYFPIIPLSNGNFGMVTTIQNTKANREGFSWWELELNTF